MQQQQQRIITCRINSVYERVKVLSISEATNEVLENEKPVSHKTLDDLIEAKIESKLTKKIQKKVRKNSSGAEKSPLRKPSSNGNKQKNESNNTQQKQSKQRIDTKTLPNTNNTEQTTAHT